jgi:DMSO/TMAO reductase YedYZ heme-binding membrane subunit
VLALGALVWGVFFSARATGNRRRPNWWLDLHNWLGGAALAFAAAHVAFAYLDRDLALGLADLVVPGVASTDRIAITWGIVAAWTFAIAVFTSWPKRRFTRRTWRILHLGSVVGAGLAILHGIQIGTDTRTLVAEGVALLLVASAVYALGLRLFGVLLGDR